MSKTTKLEAWKGPQHKRHTITLPSGAVVEIELPNLPLLIKVGKVPNDLVQVAIKAQRGDEKITKESIEEQWEFYKLLTALTVKEPELTPGDVEELPFEDVEMIVEFAVRQRDMDAVYKHMGGLEKVESFRDFRGL